MSEATSYSILNHQTGKIRVALADDHPLLRQALRITLEKQQDFEVVAEVSDGEQAVNIAKELIPDVMIMDISMPKLNGIEATRQIKANCPTVSILVLSVYDDNEHISSILQAGAAGYLTKSADDMAVVSAIRALVHGESVLSHEVSRRILEHAFQYTDAANSLPIKAFNKISVRELEILRLTAKGLSNKDIADKLSLSTRTVKSYLASLFVKLNVFSRTEAVIVGLRKGILYLEDLE